MKKIIKPYQREVSECYCDKHPHARAYTTVKIESGYGSKYDTTMYLRDLCDKCVDELIKYLNKNFIRNLDADAPDYEKDNHE